MSFRQKYEYDAMSQRPVYKSVTERLIEMCPVAAGARIADVGCGSGLATAMLLDRYPQVDSVIGVDPSEYELALARKRVVHPKVRFVAGRAQDIRDAVGEVDATILSNVMHQIPVSEREGVLAGCHHSLIRGGRCAFNTFFFKGCVAPGTENFYLRWMRETDAVLRSRGAEITRAKQMPVALQLLTLDEHGAMMERAGFHHITLDVIAFQYDAIDWKTLSNYSVFIEGATGLSDLDLGADALQTGIDRTFVAMDITAVSRNFLFATGVK